MSKQKFEKVLEEQLNEQYAEGFVAGIDAVVDIFNDAVNCVIDDIEDECCTLTEMSIAKEIINRISEYVTDFLNEEYGEECDCEDCEHYEGCSLKETA